MHTNTRHSNSDPIDGPADTCSYSGREFGSPATKFEWLRVYIPFDNIQCRLNDCYVVGSSIQVSYNTVKHSIAILLQTWSMYPLWAVLNLELITTHHHWFNEYSLFVSFSLSLSLWIPRTFPLIHLFRMPGLMDYLPADPPPPTRYLLCRKMTVTHRSYTTDTMGPRDTSMTSTLSRRSRRLNQSTIRR